MKKIIKRILAVCLSVLMLVGIYVPTVSKEAESSFVDVKQGAWYYKAVTYTAENGLMKGMGNGFFSPNVKFTRAMTVQVLAQLSGDELSGYTETDFPDVPKGKWFTTAVAWAVDKGIAVGVGDKFDPNGNVTREQLARMIHQFAIKYGVVNTYPGGPEVLDGFTDNARVSSWAKQDMEWAVYNVIMSGVGNDMLDPKGTATRAQAAQMFYYLHYMKTEGIVSPDTTDFDAITFEDSDEVRILCWGDSMTAGGYPEILRDISGYATRNNAAGGDTAEHCAMKQGALPFYVAPMTIPASNTPVRVNLLDENYKYVESLADNGNKGLTPVYISGIKGNFYYSHSDGYYYFSRTDRAPYEEVKITRLTRMISKAMLDINKNDIHVIFSGPSNEYNCDEADKLIETQRKMIDYIGHDKYVIISLTCLYYMPGLPQFNEDLAEEYGEHFLDFRSYVLESGLQDLGIEPTEQDLKDLAIGEIPSSLRSDVEHGNNLYNQLLAEQVYKKLIELGYIEAAE